MAKIKKIIPVLFLLILTIPLILPLVQPGFFVTDDGDWMIVRLAAFHSALRTGQFPVRFLYSLNHGLGYPVLNFLYPFPFYLGEIIHLLGFGFVDSVKTLFATSFILSTLGMYLLVSVEWGNRPGFIAAMIYSYAPYRIFDVYRRGSLGEAVAFIFLPLIFLFIRQLFSTDKVYFLSLAALSYAALITSHNVIAFLFSPVLLVYIIIKLIRSNDRPHRLFHSLIFYLLSTMSSSFFWFPALYDLQFTKSASRQVSNFNNYFLKANNFREIVGFLIPIILICSIILIIFRRKRGISFTLYFTLISIFMTLPISSPIWRATPLPQLIQFPWRFVSVTVFGGAILSGYIFSMVKKTILFIITIPLVIFISLPLIKTQPTNKPDSFYSTNDDSTTIKNEYMPKWVKVDPQNAPVSRTETISPSIIQINRVYFPGLKVYLDRKEVSFDYGRTGFPQVEVPTGKHSLTANFTETPLRLAADLISLAGIGVALIMLIPPAGVKKRHISEQKQD